MNKDIFATSVFIIFATIIAVIGVSFGDEITANLPGGKATGVVGAVILLVASFLRIYKSLRNMGYNRLNSEGFNDLMKIHFGAVAHGLLYVFNEAVLDAEKNNNTYNFYELYMNSKRILDEARNRLLPFCTNNIDNIPEFLDQYLSPEKLKQKIQDSIEIIQNVEGLDKKQKMVYRVIQEVQADLLRKIQLKKPT